jgi:hypothetical protein
MDKKDLYKLGILGGFILALAVFRVVFNGYDASTKATTLQPASLSTAPQYNFSKVLSAQDSQKVDVSLPLGDPLLQNNKIK